jgi:uncharacterized membrane protein HdeD (DUF308 family)
VAACASFGRYTLMLLFLSGIWFTFLGTIVLMQDYRIPGNDTVWYIAMFIGVVSFFLPAAFLLLGED